MRASGYISSLTLVMTMTMATAMVAEQARWQAEQAKARQLAAQINLDLELVNSEPPLNPGTIVNLPSGRTAKSYNHQDQTYTAIIIKPMPTYIYAFASLVTGALVRDGDQLLVLGGKR